MKTRHLLLLVAVLASSILVFSSGTFAIINDQVIARNNTFSTAKAPTPTPTVTPSPTIKPTRTPTPTPPQNCDGDNDGDDTGCITPTPTPTKPPHKRCEIDLEPFFWHNGKFIHFHIFNCRGFKRFKYQLTYDTDDAPQGVMGQEDFSDNDFDSDDMFTSQPITLGTCSTGGVCVYDKHPRHFKLKVTLLKHPNDTDGEITTCERDE
jgi:hypothetical protein